MIKRPNKKVVIGSGVIAALIGITSQFEGLSLTPYKDPANILTVCYGDTNNITKKKYTIEECKQRLSNELIVAINQTITCQPILAQPGNENPLIAFSDATYNIGPRLVCDSTAAKYLREGKIDEACKELPKWNKANVGGKLVELPGLTKRRAEEMRICLLDK